VRKPPAASPSPHERVVDDAWQEIAMRHAPRMGRFLAVGVAVGLLLALIFTTTSMIAGEGPITAGLGGVLLTFMILALIFVASCLLVSALLALLLDRLARRRATKSIADRSTVMFHDLSRPVTDDPPRRDP
jgi:hypothetical protein